MIWPNVAQTTEAVAAHYDALDNFYREIWGDHVHHGYWATGRESPEAAVEALIEVMAQRLDFRPGQQVCDIGCGYGATSRHLAGRHHLHVTGVTISGAQAKRAQARKAVAGGIPEGPLKGVPYLIKDLGFFETGEPATFGSSLFKDFVADHETGYVTRCKRAGLVFMGRSSSPEFGLNPNTEPRLYGSCHNPWNLEYSP